MMIGKINFLFLLAVSFVGVSCNKPATSGKISVKFDFNVDGAAFASDQLIYTNAAGNLYEVDEIKFFISDLKLYNAEGDVISIYDDNSIHYVDYDIASTLVWNIADNIPAGNYSAMSFVFGLSPAKNISNYFINPPESNMSWPSYLGGGYHYMQINGKWLREGISTPFNFHTGIGQRYEGDSIMEYVHNHFFVNIPNIGFSIKENKTRNIILNMNINSWFTTPHDYDFNYWGGAIMQNQAAQEVIKENGVDVFSAELLLDE